MAIPVDFHRYGGTIFPSLLYLAAYLRSNTPLQGTHAHEWDKGSNSKLRNWYISGLEFCGVFSGNECDANIEMASHCQNVTFF